MSAFSEESPAPRAGSILTGPSRSSHGSAAPGTPSTVSGQQAPVYRPVARPDAYAPSPKDAPGATVDTPRSGPPTAVHSSSPETVGAFNPVQRPLHQRLSVLRDSAFDATNTHSAAAEQDPSTNALTATQSGATDPPEVNRGENLIIAQPLEAGAGQSASVARGAPTPAVRPPSAEPVPVAGRNLPETAPTPASREARSGSDPRDGVLLAQKGPVLSVETFGPRTIAIGREASYRLSIQNAGEVGADEVIVYIQLPSWADVLGAEASMGATQPPAAGSHEGAFVWRVGHLAAKSSERLVLKLIPRQSRPFDLSVRWEYQPLLQQTLIEVQEPQVEIQLEGPREVQYGQRETYRLRMKNTGNGPAENVVITLLPVGAGSSQPVSHRLGLLDAGAEKAIEVELTARQAGSITVGVEVRGEGGLQAELAETILVRRAELHLAASGPGVRFVGSEVTYDLRVANPGNAPARNVQLSATVPSGAKYISGIDGGRLEANGTRVSWIIPQMEAGAEETYQLRASLGLPGTNRLEFLAVAEDALTASAEALTNVDAMADLAMDVEDPRSPVPVGSDTVYRLRVRNRGTKAAENVEIVAYFSRGIEPVSAEGGAHRIGPGQVVFSPIASLPPETEAVFSIRAQASQPGNHIFRAEMHCKPLDTRLVREETTHFYQDGAIASSASDAKAVNTADRRAATGEAAHPQAPSQPAPEPRR
ncbi:MAG: hypothetical protein RBS80_17240 [Thermoguttaceae bacterium]|nr:hypothetical protein [Thermoguttaceae bacterium]